MVIRVFYLYWKDLLIRKNHLLHTLTEILIPWCVIILANLFVKRDFTISGVPPVNFEPYQNGQCGPAVAYEEKIIYEPLNKFTTDIMTKAACYAGFPKNVLVPGNITSTSTFGIGVKFNIPRNVKDIPKILDYTLFPTDELWFDIGQAKKFDFEPLWDYNEIELLTLVQLQRGIEASFLDANKVPVDKLILEMTVPLAREFDSYFFVLYFAIFLCFCLIVNPIVARTVLEKATGSKEMMLMMGIRRWELWTAKILDAFVFNIILVSGMTYFLYVPLKPDGSHLIYNPYAFWGLVLFGQTSIMCFLFFFSCFFSNSTAASAVTQIFWIVSFLTAYLIDNLYPAPFGVQILMCLLPHVATMKAVALLLKFDKHKKSLRVSENLYIEENGLVLMNIITMLILDVILYMILTLYVDRLNPGKFGVPQPYNFCFLKSFWKPEKFAEVQPITSQNSSQEGFEAVPRRLTPGVIIKNVSKVYKIQKNKQKTAIDNITISFYNGEISGLLGHNGAGKTTLFSMISGLTYPSSGIIIINGYNIAVNINEARRSLGLCPQFDMLFNDLNCVEVISFYGIVKGLSLPQAKVEALHLINVLKLNNVKYTKAGNLSGGQRRKVSLAVALVGGSKVLLLDEPTTGMDPEIRREIWELLLALRGERTIILTTHFMEEADALCDRIAILDHGKVRCFGTPMYLKDKYGKGYVLSIVVLNLDKVKSVVDYVKDMAGAKFKSQNVRTLTFEIPEKEVRVFPNLFSGLEEKKKKSEIASYAVSFSALEDVFLRFSNAGNDSEPSIETSKRKTNEEQEMFLKIRVRCLCVFQLWALFIKKFIYFGRHVFIFIFYCFFSVLMLVLLTVIIESKGVVDKLDGNSIVLSPALYPSSVILLSGFTGDKKEKVVDLITSYKTGWKEVSNIPEVINEYYKTDFHMIARKIIMGLKYSDAEWKVLYNPRGNVMVPISCSFIHNYLLKSLNPDCQIQAKLSLKYAKGEEIEKGHKCRLSYMTEPIGMQTFFYLTGPFKENISGAKEIQLMIASPILYWFSHFLFDITTFFFYFLIIYIGMGFSLNDKVMLNNPAQSLGGFILLGSGLILIAYIISTEMKSPTSCFMAYLIVFMFFGVLLYYMFSFRWFPHFLRYFHPHWMGKLGFEKLCNGKATMFLLELFVYDLIIFALILLKDYRFVTRLMSIVLNKSIRIIYSGKETKDDFIKAEEDMVQRAINLRERSGTALIADNLKRWYWVCKSCTAFKAVQGISFVVNKGECFGLLGVNGAGKTTTFKMLTGAITPSKGDIYINSKRLGFFNREKLLFTIGYCPQYGGLIESFKGRELLTFFGRLRGLRSDILKDEVNKWLNKVNLMEYEKQICGKYSGGNKKKLSVAIALIGDPPLIFLDEPTSGVDPASRRIIWTVVETAQKQGQSIILTSHSMDECEALCSRLSIMVDGRFRCIGEITTLKNIFGQGYCIELKLSVDSNEKNLDDLKKAVNNAFDPGCTLVDEHLTVLQYHIKNKNLTWSDVFSKLQNLKKNFSNIESYSASSTTLEQVFIYFAENK